MRARIAQHCGARLARRWPTRHPARTDAEDARATAAPGAKLVAKRILRECAYLGLRSPFDAVSRSLKRKQMAACRGPIPGVLVTRSDSFPKILG